MDSEVTEVYREEVDGSACCCNLGYWSLSNNGVHRCRIMGVGPRHSPIMVVGEAPGTDEIEAGKPLVGMAGRYFNRMLRRAKLKRSDLYLTNVVKCRNIRLSANGKIANANPEDKHIRACMPTLDREIRMVKPKVIITLGNVALRAVTRGTFFGIYTWLWEDPVWSRRYEAWVIPILHPSALMRGNAAHVETGEYMACITRLELAKEYLGRCYRLTDSNHIVAHTATQALNLVSKVQGDFSFDLETTSDGSRAILGVGLCWDPKFGVYIPWPVVESSKRLHQKLRTLFRRKVWKAAHNVMFDRSVLEAHGIPVAEPVFDTMLAHHLINENTPQGLKELEWMVTDRGGRADWIEQYKTKEVWPLIPDEIMGEYCVDDVLSTLSMLQKFRSQLAAEKVDWVYHNVVHPHTRVVEEMMGHGPWIDQTKLQELDDYCTTGVEEEAEVIYQLAGEEFLIGSWQQLQHILYRKLRLPIKKAKQGPRRGQVTADKHALAELADEGFEIAEHLVRWSHLNHLKKSYVDRIRKKIRPDGRGDFYYLIHGTETGRMSGDFQQMPREKIVRQLIAAPPGRKLIDADFEQAELVVAFRLAGEDDLVHALLSGTDAHALTASLIFGVDIEDVERTQRDVGKTINFAVMYGMTSETLAGRLGVDLLTAERYQAAFFARAPRLKLWIQDQSKRIYEHLYSRTPLGRKRRIYGVLRDRINDRTKAIREGVNAIIQGTVPDVMHISMRRTYDQVRKEGLDSFFVGSVHDSCMCEAADCDVERVKEIMADSMQRRFPRLGIPMRADIAVVQNWWDDHDDED